jgi:hypothetical protein
MSTAGKGKNTMIFIVIGVIVCVLCCISSSIAGGIFYNYSKNPKEGEIGGKCLSNGTCKSSADRELFCKGGECWEVCEPVLSSTNCRTNYRFPRENGFYCDYGKCNDWWEEPGQDDYDENSDIFIKAMERNLEDKKIQAQEKADRKIQEEKLTTEKEIEEARQLQLCKCSEFSGVRLDRPGVCSVGKFEEDGDENIQDGSDQLKWCYVAGGEDCKSTSTKTINRSKNPKTQGMAWRLC